MADSNGSYKDDAICFFVACYHLKDWLKKDPETALIVGGDIEAYINEAKATLAICADVANYSKHGPLDSNVRLDAEAQARNHRMAVFGPFYELPDDVRSLSVHVSGSVIVRSKDRVRSASELAAGCVGAWKTCLASKGLL
jgi:hypothetical protein